MGEQATITQLGDTLHRAKDLVGRLVGDRMGQQDYAGAQAALEWAQALAAITARIQQSNGTVTPKANGATFTPKPTATRQLPFYYREPDRLMKVGPSSEGAGTYKHDVPKDHFDQIMAALAAFSMEGVRFETRDLQNQVARIPRHQPLIVLAVLEEQRLLVNTRRGQWAFVDRTKFPVAAVSVWEHISPA